MKIAAAFHSLGEGVTVRQAALSVVLSILLVACGGDGGVDTPKADFEAWKSTISSRDVDDRAGEPAKLSSFRDKASDEKKQPVNDE